MRERAFLVLIGLIALGAVSAVATACGGKSADAEPTCAAATNVPPVIAEASILRLDALWLGDIVADGGRSSQAWKTLGYNLDGLCSSAREPGSFACRRASGVPAAVASDGVDGIDNAFGQSLVILLDTLYQRPDLVFNGFSYLETQSDGTATLYLGGNTGVRFVIPLTAARLSPPRSDGSVTLAAIAPGDALVASITERANLLDPVLCKPGSATLAALGNDIRGAADLRLAGGADPTAECDGISLAITFVPTKVTTRPDVPPGCSAPDAGTD